MAWRFYQLAGQPEDGSGAIALALKLREEWGSLALEELRLEMMEGFLLEEQGEFLAALRTFERVVQSPLRYALAWGERAESDQALAEARAPAPLGARGQDRGPWGVGRMIPYGSPEIGPEVALGLRVAAAEMLVEAGELDKAERLLLHTRKQFKNAEDRGKLLDRVGSLLRSVNASQGE